MCVLSCVLGWRCWIQRRGAAICTYVLLRCGLWCDLPVGGIHLTLGGYCWMLLDCLNCRNAGWLDCVVVACWLVCCCTGQCDDRFWCAVPWCIHSRIIKKEGRRGSLHTVSLWACPRLCYLPYLPAAVEFATGVDWYIDMCPWWCTRCDCGAYARRAKARTKFCTAAVLYTSVLYKGVVIGQQFCTISFVCCWAALLVVF